MEFRGWLIYRMKVERVNMPEMANIADQRIDFGIVGRSGDKRKSKNSISVAGIKLP